MSIKLMTQIWDNGPDNQNERFVLLSLADYANDEGECWPSLDKIAQRTCLTERGVRKIVRRLTESGWLDVQVGGGRRNCNLYTVKTRNHVPPEHSSPFDENPEPECINPEPRSLNPEPRSPKPLRTVKNRHTSKREDDLSLALNHYNSAAELSNWPRVQILTPARVSALKQRLKDAGGLEGWRLALEKAQASDFLCGKNNRNFKASFDFLTRQSSFTKLMEGNYDNRPNKTESAASMGADPVLAHIARIVGLEEAPSVGSL